MVKHVAGTSDKPPAGDGGGAKSGAGVHRLKKLAGEIAKAEVPHRKRRVQHVLAQGKRFREARDICDDKESHYGHTPDSRFGRWFKSAKFAEYLPQRSALKPRARWPLCGRRGASKSNSGSRLGRTTGRTL